MKDRVKMRSIFIDNLLIFWHTIYRINLLDLFIDKYIFQMYYDYRRKLLGTHTHKNAFIVCEAEAVMARGDCGDFVKGGNLP